MSEANPIESIVPTNVHLRKTEALEITWSDGKRSVYPLKFLRRNCPCAGCQGERDLLGRQLLPVLKTVHEGPIVAEGGELVGNYALRIQWSDGHSSGIYSFRYLRALAGEMPGSCLTGVKDKEGGG